MDTSHITTDTRFITLLGKPLAQSFAARMQNRVYDNLGLDMVYYYTETDETHLAEIVTGLRPHALCGFCCDKAQQDRHIAAAGLLH